MLNRNMSGFRASLLSVVVLIVGCSPAPPDAQQLDVMVRKAIVEKATTPPIYFHEGRTAPPNPFITSSTEINLDKLLYREGWITAKTQGQWMYVALTPKGKNEVAKAGLKKIADPGYAKNTVWVIPRETEAFDYFQIDKPEATPDKITATVSWRRQKTPLGLMIDEYILLSNPVRSELTVPTLYNGTVEIARGSDGWKVESLKSDVRTDFGPMIQR
jgi:hypothetical protein